MNYIDFIIIFILGISIMLAVKKGLVLAVFNLVSWIVALILANILYPVVSGILLNTFIYTNMKNGIAEKLNISESIKDLTIKAQNDIIMSLPVPEFLQTTLLAQNNPAIYNILDVSELEDFIVSYIANIAINAISCIVVFVLVLIGMKFIAATLDIISKLPVINSVNKLAGALVGACQGTIVIWIVFLIVSVLGLNQNNFAAFQDQIYPAIQASLLGSWFYNNNLIFNFILTIVG